MPPVLFSLCIPTMNRFDDFLDQYLEIYLDMKNKGIIDEIIVCDETGEDYQRILEKYNKGDPNGPIQLYKNETRLGVFKNKIRVASYAKDGNFIALIDSDNFVNRNYFEVAKNYILKNASAGSRTRVSCLEGSDLTLRPQMQSIN